MSHTALFIGAHPDDIEIGAAATAAKLVARGWSVHFCILTREGDPRIAETREREARLAASELGVAGENVFFVGLPDAELKAEREHIDAVRHAIDSRIDGRIDLVFSHCEADAHLDHQAAARITPLAVKGCPILRYPVANLLRPVDFEPRIFVDVSDHRIQKLEALGRHESQIEKGRILFDEIGKLFTHYAEECDCAFVEPFELDYVLPTSEELLDLARGLSCKPLEGPRRRAYRWWSTGFALLAMSVAAGYYLVDLLEVIHGHRGSIILEEFRSESHLSGRIEGFAPEEIADLKVALYVLTDKWYLHPWDSVEAGKGFADIDESGSWRIATVWRGHQARRLAILLAERSSTLPSVVGSFGNADRRILSRVDHLTALIVEAPRGI